MFNNSQPQSKGRAGRSIPTGKLGWLALAALVATVIGAVGGTAAAAAGSKNAAATRQIVASVDDPSSSKTSWHRIRSLNHPTRYWRHQNFIGRLDLAPISPPADAQWQLVPGLLSGSGVSFESVNFPGRYLSDFHGQLLLQVNDGTTGFARSATFQPVKGLADKTQTSFRSVENNNLYIRHLNFELHVSTISTILDTQDATFLVD